MRRGRIVGMRMVLFGIVIAALAGWVTSALWNALVPAIFGLPHIGFWQALGLLVLGRLLFGGIGHGGPKRHGPRFVRGWHDLTPEQRERFRSAMGRHCCDRWEEKKEDGASGVA